MTVRDKQIYRHIHTGTVVLAQEDSQNGGFAATPLDGDNEGEWLDGWSVCDFKELEGEDWEDYRAYAQYLNLLPRPANFVY